MTARYALYYAPEKGSPLDEFGCRWLGHDASTGSTVAQFPTPGLPPGRLNALTTAPRHYGFHGTLKAPFALAQGRTPEALSEALAAFARHRHDFFMPPLTPAFLGDFIALVPSAPCDELDHFAAACVRLFDDFRAPLTEGEVRRRRNAGLTPAQDALMLRWGYPHVMEEFQFHLTLTGRITDQRDKAALWMELARLAGPLCREPVLVESICLFAQPDRTAPFRLFRRFPLAC